MVAALLHKVIPLELFETRRLVGAIVGVIGLAVTWRLGRRIGGPLAGLAALLLLALCPIFYGHMFMNPKDAPFAVAMIILMLGLVRLAEEYPQPSPRTILIVGLGAGLSIGSPHPRRARAGLCHDRLHAAVPGGTAHRGRARGGPAFRPCRLRAAARPRVRLSRDGPDLAVVDHGARQSLRGPDLFLALLREALEGDVRRRDRVRARHALVLSADAVRAAAARSDAGADGRRRVRHLRHAAASRGSGPPQDHPADADAGSDPAARDRDGEAACALQRHPPFRLRDPADGGARRRCLRLGHGAPARQSPRLAAGRARRCSASAWRCRSPR